MTEKWIAHVKKYREKEGCSYKEALMKAKTSYNSNGGAKKTNKAPAKKEAAKKATPKKEKKVPSKSKPKAK